MMSLMDLPLSANGESGGNSFSAVVVDIGGRGRAADIGEVDEEIGDF